MRVMSIVIAGAFVCGLAMAVFPQDELEPMVVPVLMDGSPETVDCQRGSRNPRDPRGIFAGKMRDPRGIFAGKMRDPRGIFAGSARESHGEFEEDEDGTDEIPQEVQRVVAASDIPTEFWKGKEGEECGDDGRC